MLSDRRMLYIISSSALAVLLLGLFMPSTAGRIFCAAVIAVFAALAFFFIRKRSILSINKNTVILLISVIGLLYLMFYYLSGLKFGFYRSGYKFSFYYILRFFIPISLIIAASEIFRWVIRAQNKKLADVISYLVCVITEVLIYGSATSAKGFIAFVDFWAIAVFPALVSNVLYHYLSKRYGPVPNLIYRAIITLYIYIIPVVPAMPKSLLAFLNLIIPLVIYWFLDILFEKKKKNALEKKHKYSFIPVIFTAVLMTFTMMLISNQFRFGTLVIATDSMTGTYNKGDAVIYERYDDQPIEIGQVIVFKNGKATMVHRVINIENINGVIRYYTKGDVNEDPDPGFITEGDIVGLADTKLPYLGYPSLWLRSLFKK
ncbi:MAG: signal peptidase I [Ruminococcaceae bacterium]|nr:signal peptidase I [Oscillospiraceae bacterium]